ncbi:MAG: hypothetical protein R3B45_15895 [Bdellovibrionota bacterium]
MQEQNPEKTNTNFSKKLIFRKGTRYFMTPLFCRLKNVVLIRILLASTIASCSGGAFGPESMLNQGKKNSSDSEANQLPEGDTQKPEEQGDEPEITEPIWINGVLLTCNWRGVEGEHGVVVGCEAHKNDAFIAKEREQIINFDWNIVDVQRANVKHLSEEVDPQNPNFVEFVIDSSTIAESQISVKISSNDSEATLLLPFKDGLVGFEDGSLEQCFANENMTASECMIAAGLMSRQGEVLDLTCPDGYVLIQPSPDVGTYKEFCVAKFEMSKDLTSGKAISQPGNLPWTSINQANAKAACTDLGSNYKLIANEQWMTVARAVEKNPKNWDSANDATKQLPQGNILNNEKLPAGDDFSPCSGLDSCIASEWTAVKRTMELADGQVIWDLVGNVAEWVDWNPGLGRALTPGSLLNPDGFYEIKDSTDGVNMLGNTFRPENLGLSHNQNKIGKYSSGMLAIEGAALRGGGYRDTNSAGPYFLSFNFTYLTANDNIGFRCIYSP